MNVGYRGLSPAEWVRAVCCPPPIAAGCLPDSVASIGVLHAQSAAGCHDDGRRDLLSGDVCRWQQGEMAALSHQSANRRYLRNLHCPCGAAHRAAEPVAELCLVPSLASWHPASLADSSCLVLLCQQCVTACMASGRLHALLDSSAGSSTTPDCLFGSQQQRLLGGAAGYAAVCGSAFPYCPHPQFPRWSGEPLQSVHPGDLRPGASRIGLPPQPNPRNFALVQFGGRRGASLFTVICGFTMRLAAILIASSACFRRHELTALPFSPAAPALLGAPPVW